LLAGLALSRESIACICLPPEDEDTEKRIRADVKAASLVVRAVAVGFTARSDPDSWDAVRRWRVLEVWKGEVQVGGYIHTRWGTCPAPVKTGDDMLLYLHSPSPYVLESCDRHAWYPEAQAEAKVLSRLFKPK
jgi:hypothetical protein